MNYQKVSDFILYSQRWEDKNITTLKKTEKKGQEYTEIERSWLHVSHLYNDCTYVGYAIAFCVFLNA